MHQISTLLTDSNELTNGFTASTNTIWLFLILAVVIVLTVYIGTLLRTKDTRRAHNEIAASMQHHPATPQATQIIDTLNFMLQHNIIDHNQYNDLMIKCLPYIK